MNLKRKKHRVLALALWATLSLGAIPEMAYCETTAVETQLPTQQEIVEFAQEHPTGETYFDQDGNMLKDYSIDYEEEPTLKKPYGAGQLKQAEEIRALNTVRLIRYITGLSGDVYLFDPYRKLAQSAALINYLNVKASHSPSIPGGMSEELATAAVQGSEDSNIDKTSWQNNSLKSSIIYAWMYDSDSANIKSLGHRRWLLNPALVMTGFGSVTGTKGTCNTMYIRNRERDDLQAQTICWPTKNTPTSFFAKNSAWSISVGEEVNASTAVVSLLRMSDYKTWVFSSVSSDGDFYVNNQNYGQKGCIIFKPEALGEIKAGDKFVVYVSYNKKNISYEVNFFDLEHYYSTAAPVISALSVNPADKPTIEWNSVRGAESYDLYRKAKGGSWKLISQDLDEPYFDDASASAGIKYYYRVVAKRTVGGTVYESEPASAKTVTTPLTKPVISSCAAYYAGANRLQWKAVSKATGYKVYRRVSGKSTWTLMATTKNKSYIDKKATRGVKYEYRIRAYRTTYKNTVYSSYSSKRSVRTR